MSDDAAPSRARLGRATGLAFAAATLIFVTTVLPAEFGRDPTGFGRLTGISKLALSAPAAAPVMPVANAAIAAAPGAVTPLQEQGGAPRSDEFSIPLEFADELEFKVRMKAGSTLVYSLTVQGARSPEEAYADFHGDVPHAEPEQVVEYRQATGLASHGALRAPMDGVHGWFLQNRGDDRQVVRLRLSGFYELIPAGEYGNERGIQPQP
jgi:hypothetical protein